MPHRDSVRRIHTSPLTLFNKLPKEILELISSFLEGDRNSAISLCRTSRIFTSLADRHIWHSLNIYDDLSLLIEDNDQRERAYIAAIRSRMRGIMCAADERRLGYVEGMKMSLTSGVAQGALHLLDTVSSTLTSLDVLPPAFCDTYPLGATMDAAILSCRLSCPSLTHLSLACGTATCLGIPIILDSSPNLITLRLDLTHHLSSMTTPDSPIPPFPDETKLERLQLVFGRKLESEDLTPDFFAPVAALLEKSPLRQLALDYQGYEEWIRNDLLDAVNTHETLEELYWPVCTYYFAQEGTMVANAPYLRTVIIDCAARNTDIFEDVPMLPALRSACYVSDFADTDLLEPHQRIPLPSCAFSMHHLTLAEQLHTCPHLRYVNTLYESDFRGLEMLDSVSAVETEGQSLGYVSSYLHDGSEGELLHAKLKLYLARTVKGLITVHQHHQGEWCDLTDFRDMVVPLELLEQMRVVDGKSKEEWDARGVNVGDAAWKILTDRRESEEIVLATETLQREIRSYPRDASMLLGPAILSITGYGR